MYALIIVAVFLFLSWIVLKIPGIREDIRERLVEKRVVLRPERRRRVAPLRPKRRRKDLVEIKAGRERAEKELAEMVALRKKVEEEVAKSVRARKKLK